MLPPDSVRASGTPVITASIWLPPAVAPPAVRPCTRTSHRGLTTGAAYTLSYWYRAGSNGGTLTLRLSGSGITSTVTAAPENSTYTGRATPGASNAGPNACCQPSPCFGSTKSSQTTFLVLSMPLATAIPWVELYNAGSSNLFLGKMWLTDDYVAPAKWAFPLERGHRARAIPRGLVPWRHERNHRCGTATPVSRCVRARVPSCFPAGWMMALSRSSIT